MPRMRSGGIAPLILYLGISLRCVVKFTPLPLYPLPRKNPSTLSTGGFVGSTTGVEVLEKKQFLTQIGNRTLAVQPAA
jgi:hypothetical protein